MLNQLKFNKGEAALSAEILLSSMALGFGGVSWLRGFRREVSKGLRACL